MSIIIKYMPHIPACEEISKFFNSLSRNVMILKKIPTVDMYKQT